MNRESGGNTFNSVSEKRFDQTHQSAPQTPLIRNAVAGSFADEPQRHRIDQMIRPE